MQLRQYALMVWRWLWLVVLGTALAAGAAFIVSRRTQPVYSATVTLLINQPPSYGMASADYTSILSSERLASTYSELLRTPKVLGQVADKLALPSCRLYRFSWCATRSCSASRWKTPIPSWPPTLPTRSRRSFRT